MIILLTNNIIYLYILYEIKLNLKNNYLNSDILLVIEDFHFRFELKYRY